MGKYSFKVSWIDDVQEFKVLVLQDNEVIEEDMFMFCSDAWEYIADTMGMLQIAGEDWTLTY